MRESDLQTRVTNWLKNNFWGCAAFELKITKEGYISFSDLRVHQRDSLLAVKHRRLVYKIPDDSRGFKPFDCFAMALTQAFVVIQFWKPGERRVYFIDIDDWVREEALAGSPTDGSRPRKSLTEERAAQIGQVITLGERGMIVDVDERSAKLARQA